MPTAPGGTQRRGVPLPTGIYNAATSRKGMRWSPAGDYVVISTTIGLSRRRGAMTARGT